jgi:death on curing protein
VNDPIWIEKTALLLLHAAALAEHGGPEGLRDDGLLESALARPKNLHAYEGVVDLPRLAACYAVGIARNHPFVDGNKRAAFISMAAFLRLNGLRLAADQVDAVRTMEDVAAGEITEDQLATWILANTVEAG